MEDVFKTEEKQLKPYKGYEIWKLDDYNVLNKKINTSYEVADQDDAIDFFESLAAAKKYIDTILI